MRCASGQNAKVGIHRLLCGDLRCLDAKDGTLCCQRFRCPLSTVCALDRYVSSGAAYCDVDDHKVPDFKEQTTSCSCRVVDDTHRSPIGRFEVCNRRRSECKSSSSHGSVALHSNPTKVDRSWKGEDADAAAVVKRRIIPHCQRSQIQHA